MLGHFINVYGEANFVGGGDNIVYGHSNVVLGRGAKCRDESGFQTVTIGLNSSSGRQCVTLGQEAQTNDRYSMAAGHQAVVEAGAGAGIAHGRAAKVLAVAVNSVALGYGAIADEADTVAVGRGSAAGSGPATRRITDVTAGINPTDAANRQQLDARLSQAQRDAINALEAIAVPGSATVADVAAKINAIIAALKAA